MKELQMKAGKTVVFVVKNVPGDNEAETMQNLLAICWVPSEKLEAT